MLKGGGKGSEIQTEYRMVFAKGLALRKWEEAGQETKISHYEMN